MYAEHLALRSTDTHIVCRSGERSWCWHRKGNELEMSTSHAFERSAVRADVNTNTAWCETYGIGCRVKLKDDTRILWTNARADGPEYTLLLITVVCTHTYILHLLLIHNTHSTHVLFGWCHVKHIFLSTGIVSNLMERLMKHFCVYVLYMVFRISFELTCELWTSSAYCGKNIKKIYIHI